jgi:hypothetical protein
MKHQSRKKRDSKSVNKLRPSRATPGLSLLLVAITCLLQMTSAQQLANETYDNDFGAEVNSTTTGGNPEDFNVKDTVKLPFTEA